MTEHKKNPALIKSNSAYDILKQAALVTLPALGTLYFALSQIWGLPHASQVVGTITAIDAFLGLVLHISNVQYQNSDAQYDGSLNVSETDTSQIHQLALDTDPDDLGKQKSIKLKVNKVKT